MAVRCTGWERAGGRPVPRLGEGRWPSGAQVGRGQVAVRCAGRERAGGRPVHSVREDCSPLSTCAPDGHLQRVTIPDAV